MDNRPRKTSRRRLTQDIVSQRFINVHGETYDYSKVVFTTIHDNVTIICPEHGEFEQTPKQHFKKSSICPKCNVQQQKKHIDFDIFQQLASNKHKHKFKYIKSSYTNFYAKVSIICPEHGEFEQRANAHLHYRHGCQQCANNGTSINKTKSQTQFIEHASSVHNNKFDYSKVQYIATDNKVSIICPEHGEFEQTPRSHLGSAHGCQQCAHKSLAASSVSQSEFDIYDFIAQHITAEQSNRVVLNGKELDIYIPSKKLAIEFNGLFWHNEHNTHRAYHLQKTDACLEQDIQLIHIFEDEWLQKPEIVKSRLLHAIGCTPTRIYARKTKVKEIPTHIASQFLIDNHIQGKVGSRHKLGLYHNDELVALMTFGALRKNMGRKAAANSYELLRFCNKLNTTVIGGASKLFQHFLTHYQPSKIISYADRRWSNGQLYFNLGFKHTHNSGINYFYIVDGCREYRYKYRKNVLVEQGEDASLTEHQIMLNRGIPRIYDCGNMVFEYNL